MTAEVTVQLHCDGCETTYPANPRVTSSVTDIRAAAKSDGWRSRVRRGEREDHCQDCQEVIA
jgi:hypothetical protein